MAILFFAWGCGTKTPEVRGLNRRREADGSMPVHAQHERVKVGEANPSTSTRIRTAGNCGFFLRIFF